MSRLKDLRKERKLTQNEIAKILGTKQRTYSHYENGTRKIPITLLIRLSDYYNVSIEYIIKK